MPPAIFHPGFRRLSLYADGDLGVRARRKMDLHLARCAACRATLVRIHALDAKVRSLTAPPLPPALRERVLARHAAGETVILPLADPPARRTTHARWRVAAVAAVLLALVAAPFVRPGHDLEANRSELVFAPATPRPGASVHVTYRPGSALSGESRLRLRARYLRHDDLPVPGVGRQATVAELARGDDGLFRGTLRLPDSVVYAAFAVEDPRGERVDSNGRKLWELLAHGPDGRPLFEALAQRQFDHQASNWELSMENARQAAALYPDRVDAWFNLYFNERASYAGPAEDSARARALVRLAELDRRLRPRTDLHAESELGIITRFAAELGDTARYRYWRGRLLRTAPNSLWGVQERFFDLVEAAGHDPRGALSRFEALWSEADPRVGTLFLGLALDLAESTGDVEEVRRWVDRLYRADPNAGAEPWLASRQALRGEALARLRARIGTLESVDDAVRPLEHSVEEERLARREEASRLLADLGVLLLEEGRREAALDTLSLATRAGWDAALFRRVAGLRLQVGDTAGAALPLALAAVDPLEGAALGDDSVRVLLGPRYDEAAWRELLAGARREMRARVLVHSTRRPLPERIRLRGADGRDLTLREAAGGRATLVAFWSRYCPPAAEQLPRLQRVAAGLRARGYAVVTVAEPLTPGFRDYLRENGIALPVYEDPWEELERGLGQWGTPSYYVLDAAGSLRSGPSNDLTAIPAWMAVAAAEPVRR